MSLIREVFNEYKSDLKDIKVDGLPNIIRSRFLAIKIMWMVILVVSICTCVTLVIFTIQEFLKYQVLTTYRLVNEQQAIFPTIIVCNMNALNTPKAASLFLKANITDDAANLHDLDMYVKQTTGSYMTMEEKQSLGSFQSVLLSCSFKNQPCNYTNFSFILDPNNNLCYRFNYGLDKNDNSIPLNYLDVPGDTEELAIELYAGISDVQNNNIFDKGFAIFIRNQTDFPFSLSPAPITISPGFAYDITVQRSFYKNFNQWPYLYSECTVNEDGTLIKKLSDSSIFDKVSQYTDFRYTRNTCYLYCFQVLNAHIFNCSDYFNFFQIPGYDYCGSDITPISESNPGSYVRDYCLARCPLECFQQVLDCYTSSGKYPASQRYADSIYPNLVAEHANETDYTHFFTQNIVQFSVFYKSLSYILIEEEARLTIVNIIGEIGGHLHLFLGMSMLSFFEVGEMLFVFSFFLSKSKLKQKPVSNRVSIVNLQVQPATDTFQA